MNKESSDEKLLKLIEGSAKGPRLSSIGVMRKKPKFGAVFSFAKFRLKLTLFNVNKFLFIAGVLLTAVFFYSVIAGHNPAASGFLLDSIKDISSFKKPKPETGKGIVSLQEYLDLLDRRNVFLAAGFSQKEAIDTVAIADLVKDLKLVGIIWSNNPEAMIEDVAENRTLLLKKGEKFRQDMFKIKDITRSSAILDINLVGQHTEYELR